VATPQVATDGFGEVDGGVDAELDGLGTGEPLALGPALDPGAATQPTATNATTTAADRQEAPLTGDATLNHECPRS